MYSIGEFSKINHVTVKTLRHYDKVGLIKPAEVDTMTGYRYYTSTQLPHMQKIIALKQIGFTLDEIRQFFTDAWKNLLIAKQVELSHQVLDDQLKLQRLNHYLAILEKEGSMDYHMTIKDLPEVTVASMRTVIKNYEEYNTLYPKMGDLMRRQKLECINPGYCFTLYHDKEFKEHDIDVEICESVVAAGKDEGGMTFKTIPAVPQAACVYHKGPYSTINKAYAALSKWISENGYKLTGLMRESYIDGIWNKDNPQEWLTEIQAPITSLDR